MQSESNLPGGAGPERASGPGKHVLRIGLPLAVVGLGVVLFLWLKTTSPKVERRAPAERVTLVEVLETEVGSAPTLIQAMGTVVPAQEVVIRPQVSGTIVDMADEFEPGGLLQAGQEILRIDPTDYEIEVRKARSRLAKARADLRLEQGRQEVARRELDLLQRQGGDPLEITDLALRKPQLEQARADVAVAAAELAKAELDLSRTTLSASFNSMVTARNVNLGSRVKAQDDLGTLAGTDEYWIRAQVGLERLRLLNLDEEGAPAEVVSQTSGATLPGRAMRLVGKVDEDSRMATVLVTVEDPLGRKSGVPGREPGGTLMLGDYVTVDIQGRRIKGVAALPRGALRQDDVVWLARKGRLAMVPVKVAWQGQERVLVSRGLQTGDLVVVSDIAAPVEGMVLDLPGAPGAPGAGEAP